jgi:hypothetical protein
MKDHPAQLGGTTGRSMNTNSGENMSEPTVTPTPENSATVESWGKYNDAFDATVARIVKCIRRVEVDGETYDAVRPEVTAALASMLPRPVPITDEDRAEAARLIDEVGAAGGDGDG